MPRPPGRLVRHVTPHLTGLHGVAAVIAVLLAILAALLPGLLTLPAVAGDRLPFWALLVMFGAVEVCVLHLQVRREAHSVSLHEIPLVLGLFLAAPWAVLLARLLGPLPVLLFVRRQPLVKVAYNEVLFVTDAAVALAVFRLFPVHDLSHDLVVWAATAAAVTVAASLAATSTTMVIAAYERRLEPRDLWSLPLQDAPRAMAVAVLGLISVYALATDSGAAAPLLASAGVVLVAYRAYAALSERHLSLERLYQFSQVVSSSPEVDEVLRSVLTQAKEMLHAESAEVTFLSTREGGKAVRVVLPPTGRLQRYELDDLGGPDGVWARVLDDEAPLLLPRNTRDPALQRSLVLLGYRDAALAPLRGEAGIVGTLLVGDRLGDIRSFDPGDVRLLETVANHAGVALQNGRLIDQLRHDALHDALTGLPNRVHLQRELVDALAAVDDGRSPGAAVMVLDLDGFKDVNDTLGHQQGDALLVEVATRLRTAVDSAGEVVRLGGDEFAVLLPACADEETALRVGRRVLAALEQPIPLEGLDVEVGASVGVALAPLHAAEPSALLKRADLAMYGAKGSTGGLRVFEPDLDATDPRRLTLVSELRAALLAGDLEVHVQPQADLGTGGVACVEALVRWTHATLGRVGPDEFVPVAERSGLIQPLTTLVLNRALAACAEWRAQGLEVGVAVNLSTRSLLDADLVHEVSRLLARFGVPGRLLTLEITESGVMADPARAVALLHQLRELGVRLSVDDFGTGYSSLSYLKRLPVQEVKIDKSFITDLRPDSDDAVIVRSIVDLGRHLGLDVVAEGVEDAETWDLLRRTGCTLGQGWHLARPMPTDELPAWMAAHQPGRYAAGAAVPAPRDGQPAAEALSP